MLSRVLRPQADRVYILLRIVTGLMFSFHGMQKIFGILTTHKPAFGSQLWIGGLIELTTGLLVAAGAFTTVAAFLASGTMAVAYVQFHWKLQGGGQLLPAINKGEMAALYAFVFLYIACRGPVGLAFDRRR
jgi:putative oxidoreductase